MIVDNKTLSIDFDGVIHRYGKGWLDGSIYDGIVEGAKDKINLLYECGFRIIIHTTRGGKQSQEVEKWLAKKGVKFDLVTNQKLPSMAYIDDRAVRFTNWEDIVKYFI